MGASGACYGYAVDTPWAREPGPWVHGPMPYHPASR